MQNCKQFFDFLLRKDFDLNEIEQDLSDRWTEDEFNCYIAEKALDIAFDVYPDTNNADKDMDNRHEFVSEFMEYVRNTVVKKWAGNLGMVTIEKAQENANAQAEEVAKIYKKKIELCEEKIAAQAKNFANMSAYQFSAWKMDYDKVTMKDDTMPSEYEPQDSEDEAWEQIKVFQKDNFGDYDV